jgi:hypothetical protein
MRFLVDECTGPKVASWLAAQSHEVFSVFDEVRGSARKMRRSQSKRRGGDKADRHEIWVTGVFCQGLASSNSPRVAAVTSLFEATGSRHVT